MIFSLWFVVWVAVFSTTAWHLLLPSLCLTARGSYLSRRVLPGKGALLTGLVVYLLVWITLPDRALMFSLRTLLFLGLIEHLLDAARARGLRLRGVQYDAANTMHLIGRSLRVARARMAELKYSKELRMQREESPLRRRLVALRANPSYWRAAGLEFLQLVSSFEDIIRARGSFPHPSAWQDPRRLQAWLYAADGILLAVALVGFFSVDAVLLPDALLQAAGYLRGLLSAMSLSLGG